MVGLNGQVTGLIDSNVLDSNQAQPLLVKLDSALWAEKNGAPTEAMEALMDFTSQVNAYVAAGQLSETDAQSLIETAEALLQELDG